MSNISDYWSLDRNTQQAIKDAHPITPLRQWTVTGRLNVQYTQFINRSFAYGFDVKTTVTAFDAQAAADKVAKGIAAHYSDVTSFEWLNDGPAVSPVYAKV
jgi:hypothetical protein